ncbi:NADH-quinone oxidoreductase subunit NuoE family protein [Natronospora cellulosivora (SeqCode)]
MKVEKQYQEKNTQTKEEKNLDKDKYEELKNVIQEYKEKEGSLITILHQAQKIFGHLPREVQIYVAKSLGIPLAEVYGVVSFYSLFNMEKRGKYTIEICMGTACYVKGSEEILKILKEELKIEPGEITEDGKFTIETTRCIGACSLAPVINIGDDIHGKVKGEEILEIIKKYE